MEQNYMIEVTHDERFNIDGSIMHLQAGKEYSVPGQISDAVARSMVGRGYASIVEAKPAEAEVEPEPEAKAKPAAKPKAKTAAKTAAKPKAKK
jgi:protein tyrosine phosphatase (PTP) superfamily phosphohydrolase (DUF442 family)